MLPYLMNEGASVIIQDGAKLEAAAILIQRVMILKAGRAVVDMCD